MPRDLDLNALADELASPRPLSAHKQNAILRAYMDAAVAERRKAQAAGVAWKDWPQSDALLAARDRARAAGLIDGDANRAEVTDIIRAKVAEVMEQTGCLRPDAIRAVLARSTDRSTRHGSPT